jgi:hypothetical protein
MYRHCLLVALLAGSLATAGEPACDLFSGAEGRKLFQSDRAFPTFIGPISNPVLSKDPRSLTEARALFVGDWIPQDHPFNGGDFQVYGLQLRLALTDRLTFIADKDGYASIHPGTGNSQSGFLDVAAGLKYALVRDVERQMLVSVGAQFEPQTGESKVFQGHGDGLFTVFTSVGKGFAGDIHFLTNAGYQFPVDSADNSSFFYSQLHLDKQFFCWLSPLVELNWFHWTHGGNRGLPPALGEVDGLINLGTSGVAGNDFVTIAVGFKAKINDHLETGAAYETPLSNRKDFLDHRILAEFILRY